MAAQPTLSEVVRRLEDLAADVRGWREDLDKNYVRQDVYRSDQQLASQERRETAAQVLAIANEAKVKAAAVERRVTQGEDDRNHADAERASIRRLVTIALTSSFITPVVAALFARALS